MVVTDSESFFCSRETTCCVTGHRSRDLPFGGDMRRQGMKCLASMLDLLIEEAYKDGYRTFISGMAEGVDLICARIVYNLRASGKFPGMKLVCALPYEEQSKEISDPMNSYTYSIIISNCDEKVVVSKKEDKDRYRLRNKFMVDHSSRIIGAYKYKQRGSGTLQTINMAKREGLDLKIIDMDKNPVIYCDTGNFSKGDFPNIVTV